MIWVLRVVLVLHLLGAAAIIGPWLAAPRAGVARAAMVWGARAQLVTGLLLVGLVYATDGTPNNAKLGVKLLVALACVACLEIASGRQRRAAGTPAQQLVAARTGAGSGEAAATAVPVAAPLVTAGALLAILNVVIAVLWS